MLILLSKKEYELLQTSKAHFDSEVNLKLTQECSKLRKELLNLMDGNDQISIQQLSNLLSHYEDSE